MEKIANIDIKLLTEEFGTPLYVYDYEKIENNYKKMHGAFSAYYPATKIHFSVKSNSNVEILKIFRALGAGADCSSPVEILLAEKAGFPAENIIYTGNYESNSDFEEISKRNLRLNFDDFSSFNRYRKFGLPETVSFRINPGIGKGGYEGITTGGTDAKFGVPYEKAADAYRAAIDAGARRFGIHMMTGSNNLEPYYFAEVVEKLMKIAGGIFNKLGIKPEYVDIGGGMGIPYEEGDEELDIESTAKLVTEVFTEYCKKFEFGSPDLLLEPGRYLIGNAGWLLAEVTGIKKSYKNFVGINAGMNTLIRPALYGARHRVSVYGKNELSQIYNLCGQICENSDIFLKGVFLPEVEQGDIMVFQDTGAYGYVMSSVYNNRPRPAEVLIENGAAKQIRRRETPQDMLALY